MDHKIIKKLKNLKLKMIIIHKINLDNPHLQYKRMKNNFNNLKRKLKELVNPGANNNNNKLNKTKE